MTSDAQKRAFVYDLYAGPKWKKQVDHMADDQITAIYLRHRNEGTDSEETPSEPEPLTEVGTKDTLVNVPRNLCGPHENEDDFPTY